MSSPEHDTTSDAASASVLPDGFEDSTDFKQISYREIYNTPQKFTSPQRKVFIPNQDIKVKIVDVEHSVGYALNPNLYIIRLTHGKFTWIIKKRYKHFQNLHQQLRIYRATMAIPFPSKVHREYRRTFRHELMSSDLKKIENLALPSFPTKAEAMVAYENLDQREKELEEYLSDLLKINVYRNHHETIKFLEVSQVSFLSGLGEKGKEGAVQKKMGSTRPGQGTFNFCGLLDSSLCTRCKYIFSDILGQWQNRWLFVKDTCLGYIHPKDGSIKCVMLFDAGFEVSSGTYATSINSGFQINNLSRQLVVKAWTRRRREDWVTFIKEISINEAKDFTQKNRYNSFAPHREFMQAAWFVDGCSYMAAVADALESAKEEIFIADWWLSPEILMKRPSVANTWRLDMILKRKAEEGVKIFILLYKEVELALRINSDYSKDRLVCTHKNIQVLRHPDHTKSGVYFWAHHEKIVAVDQTYAFLGGIDLCYGRWDDHNHRLTDLGNVPQTLGPFLPKYQKCTSSSPTSETNPPQYLLHLTMASNVLTAGALSVSSPNLYRSSSLRQSTNGESLHKSLSMCSLSIVSTSEATTEENEKGVNTDLVFTCTPSTLVSASPPNNLTSKQPLEDVQSDSSIRERDNPTVNVHFASRTVESKEKQLIHQLHQVAVDRNDKETQGRMNATVHIVEYLEEYSNDTAKEKCCVDKSTVPVEYETLKYQNVATVSSGRQKLWIGKDYINFIVKDCKDLDSPFEDLVNRITTPRMPWHDIGVMVQGAAARDVARHFIQRWNDVKEEKANCNPLYQYLLPKSYSNLDKVKPILQIPTTSINCQVVRSIAQWSGGFLDPDTLEQGIHEAYLDVITNSKHYIYIENQFFITLTSTSTSVKNQIGEALYKRILRAHKENAVFRVYVIMPLLPGFEGDVGSPSATALHAIIHWNYSSICRGEDALLNRLNKAGILNPMEYISFHGLRTHSCLNGDLISELIYVHSKLLIADDNVVICGSANINDRSLIGERDSEIAVVLKDNEYEDGVMNGNSFKSGKFAGSLRRYLFKEHLGILTHSQDIAIDIKDPIIASFYHDTWRKIADENTDIYEKVFHCLPSDQATCFVKLKEFLEEECLKTSNRVAADSLLSHVHGNLVNLPLNFLRNEVLTPNTIVEGILPSDVWT